MSKRDEIAVATAGFASMSAQIMEVFGHLVTATVTQPEKENT